MHTHKGDHQIKDRTTALKPCVLRKGVQRSCNISGMQSKQAFSTNGMPCNQSSCLLMSEHFKASENLQKLVVLVCQHLSLLIKLPLMGNN